MRLPAVLDLLAGWSLLCAVLAPAPVFAQLRMAPRPDLSDSTTRACIAALPRSDFKSTVVELGAGGEFSRDSAAMQSLFLLAQDVGTRIREQLGAAPGVVPSVDSTLPWTAVWGRLNGELHVDGLVTIEPREARTAADTLALPGDRLIERALQSLIAEDERWPFEPLEFVLSMPFTLFFAAPELTAENSTTKVWRSIGVPVFSRGLPKYAPVRWAKETTRGPNFTRWERQGMFADSTTLRFRYDADGMVDVRSAREIPWRGDVQGLGFAFGFRPGTEPTGERRRASSHREFVLAMANSLVHSRWSVGQLGSCPLPRVAYQSFRVTFGAAP